MKLKKQPEYKFGYTSTYIQDHNFKHCCSIPIDAAVEWVKCSYPNVDMGNGTLAKDLTVYSTHPRTDANGNGWLNKLFILVQNDHDKWVALVNWDGRFSIYTER